MSAVRDGLVKHLPNLKRYARVLCKRYPHTADDLIQITIVRALQKEDFFVEDTDLRAWLFTIMHSQHVNIMRKNIRESGNNTNNPELLEYIPATSNSESNALIKDLVACLKKLPPEQARIVMLVGYHGMSYEQVARIEKLEIGTVRSRLARGRDKLRNLMAGVSIVDSNELDLIKRWGNHKWN